MTYRTFSVAAICAALFAMIAPLGAVAVESRWDASPEARARLVAGVTATGVEGSAPFGLEIVLKEGWKTYWRAPGPQGYPPRLDWTGSENVASAEFVWPTPKRFTILGYDSIGYDGGVMLPLNVVFKDPGKAASLRLTVDYLTCADVCIPQTAKLALDLPAGPPSPTGHAFAVDRSRGQAPAPPSDGARLEKVWLAGPADQPVLMAEGVSGAPLVNADIFVDVLPGYFFRAPRIEQLEGGRFRLAATAIEAPPEPAEAGLPASYVVRLDGRAIEQSLQLSAPTSTAPVPETPTQGLGSGLLLMLGIAFLGGLVLNVMPCVLPVLAIKLMSALKHAEGGRAQVRRGFLASAAGIVVSFMALAGGAIALRSAGVAVGWGMQFQQPLFVAFMALALALFAANLWGLFEFRTLAVVNRAGAAGPDDSQGLSGAFWTGVLATALATPCSAPFVGAALSFALSQGTVEILAIFFAMGLGLAAPYLLTAAAPSLARLLPRPGRWMGMLRAVLGVAVALTGVWLLWVLQRQAGTPAALAAFAASVVAVLAISKLGAGLRWGGVGATLVAGLAAVWFVATPPNSADAAAFDWARFNEAEIDRRVAKGEVVLVDVTADWCVTCKWNKATVLSQDPVASVLMNGVTPMQADWTRPDPKIGEYLAKHGRFGIPFNIVYGPGAPAGVPLPELLDADTVLEAIEKARGPAG